MELDPRVPGRESKKAAEKLSRILVDVVPGVAADIRYHFAKSGFQLTAGPSNEEGDSLFLSFAQIHELNEEEIRTLIGSAFQGEDV